ncbi:MAG: hypothetical protein AAFY98_11470 [Verrucomicrobiota bacterium]
MEFKYHLPEELIEVAKHFKEFANGGAQATFKLKNGRKFGQGLISNSTWIIAMRGHQDLPFELEEIDSIYQTEEDKNPKERGEWYYWDEWE